MIQDVSYIDFFERHSFGEVPLLVYDRFMPDENGEGAFALIGKIPASEDIIAFLVPTNYWEKRLGEAVWRTISFFKQAVVSGSLVKGKIIKHKSHSILEVERKVSGNTILSSAWGASGTRHIDFIERAIPVPEDEEGFHDYIRRWRERELRDQGYLKDEMDPEIYHDQFMKIRGPVRYHFYLHEEADNEPECYFREGKIQVPEGFPIFEDLRIEKLDSFEGDEYWGPIWQDPEYPHENSIWIWIVKKDSRLKSQLVLAHKSGKISLMLVPFYFSFVI